MANGPNLLSIEKSGVIILSNEMEQIKLFDLEESDVDVFITLVGNSNKLLVYKNGKKVNLISLKGVNLSSLISNLQNGFDDGEITNLKISSFALSSKRVLKNYLDFSKSDLSEHLKDKIVTDSNLKLYYSASNIDGKRNFATSSTATTSWKDLSGNNNNGTLYSFALNALSGWDGNNVYSNPSKLTFDGVNDFVQVANSSPLNFTATTPFTFEFWINADTQAGKPSYIFSKRPGYGRVGYEILLYNTVNQNLYLRLFDTNGFDNILVLSPSPANQWTHVVVSYDGSSKASGVKFYYNGELKSIFVGIDKLSSSTKFDLGSLRLGATEYGGYSFKGALGDVRVYNKALSQAEILQNYRSEQAKYFQGPNIISLSPADDSTGVPIQSDLVINFDQTVSKGSGNITIKKSSNNSTVETIDVASGRVALSGMTATINPVNNLSKNTSYHIEADQNTFKYNGVSFLGILDTTIWNFTTSNDSTTPKIIALSPEDNSQAAPIAGDLVLTFDEIVYPSTGDIRILDDDDANPGPPPFGVEPILVETISVTSSAVTGGGTNMITINPSENLSSDTLYSILLDSGSLQDVAGNASPAIKYHEWLFLTVDTTPINVVSLSPSDDAINVSANTNLQINFNKPVMVNTGNITIRKPIKKLNNNLPTGNGDILLNPVAQSADDSIVETIDVTSSAVTGSGTSTITINPSTDLDSDTEYYVNVDANAFDDTASNNFIGITDKFTWSFKTADTVAPVIKTFSPLDGATNVNANSDLIIVFSEPVLAKIGNINVYKLTTNPDEKPVETIDVNSDRVAGSGTDTVTINPVKDLEEDVKYYINIDSMAFTDVAGNAFSGISTRGTWNFQILDVTAPTITSLTPTDNAVDVMVDSNLDIIFSETIFIGTGNINVNKSADNTIVEMIDVTSGSVTGVGTNSITINPVMNFTEGTSYFITIAQGAFADFYGNTFSGISNKSVWDFTTVAPEIIPAENQDGGGIIAGGGNNIEINPVIPEVSPSSSSSSSSSSGGSSSSSSGGSSLPSSSSGGFIFPFPFDELEEDPSSLLISPLTITGPEIIKPNKKKIALTISHPEVESEIKCSVIPIGLVKILTKPKNFSFTPGADTVDVKLKINKKVFKKVKKDSSKRNVQIKVLCDDGEKSLDIELAPK
ncbi:MAG: Ig-like domain-containing protein [Candidatus Melainabacteria bacterium]|nr:Ig-like domain-containing protein [Candidatus Melainabacteria bacterium]